MMCDSSAWRIFLIRKYDDEHYNEYDDEDFDKHVDATLSPARLRVLGDDVK